MVVVVIVVVVASWVLIKVQTVFKISFLGPAGTQKEVFLIAFCALANEQT